MLKTIISRTGESVLPTIGGIGGGVAGWVETYSTTIWSAVIFATIGGILGFLIGKFMQWTWKCLTKKNEDDEGSNQK